MPPETVALRGTLDDTKALTIVDELIRGGKGKGAGVYEAYLPERAFVFEPRVEGAHIAFDVLGPQIPSEDQPDLNCRKPTGELIAVAEKVPTRCTLTFDLRSMPGIGVNQTHGNAAGLKPLAAGYTVYARQSFTTGIFINITGEQLSPLLAALTRLSPSAKVVQGGGDGDAPPSPPNTPAPRLSPDVAILSYRGARLEGVDGQPPAPCDHCDLTLKPGAHWLRFRYWETGYLDRGIEVTLLPGPLPGPDLEVVLVKSRSARDLRVTLLPGHKYSLWAGMNAELDDWHTSLYDETAGAMAATGPDAKQPLEKEAGALGASR
jgi:hypothetical protein